MSFEINTKNGVSAFCLGFRKMQNNREGAVSYRNLCSSSSTLNPPEEIVLKAYGTFSRTPQILLELIDSISVYLLRWYIFFAFLCALSLSNPISYPNRFSVHSFIVSRTYTRCGSFCIFFSWFLMLFRLFLNLSISPLFFKIFSFLSLSPSNTIYPHTKIVRGFFFRIPHKNFDIFCTFLPITVILVFESSSTICNET